MALVPTEVAPILNKVAAALKARGETVAVAESVSCLFVFVPLFEKKKAKVSTSPLFTFIGTRLDGISGTRRPAAC